MEQTADYAPMVQILDAPVADVIKHPVEQTVVVEDLEVFLVFSQDRVIPFLPSRTLTFQLRVLRLTIFIKILFLQLVLQICWKKALFPVGKLRRFRPPKGRNWARTSAHGLRELSWWVAG